MAIVKVAMVKRFAVVGLGLALVCLALPSRAAMSPDEEKRILELEEAARTFTDAGMAYDEELQSLLNDEIARRKNAINRNYRAQAKGIEDDLRTRRREAIDSFERFLKRYPDNSTYTPEVLFRLAKLYFDDTQDSYLVSLPEYDNQVNLYNRGKLADPPPEPVRDFSKALNSYETLLARFPQYVNADTAYYALAFTLRMSDEYDKAVAMFRDLIEKHPKSRWVPEAWLLVGEHFFDMGSYLKAIEAYNKALEFVDHRYYGITLYKMAWAYFQNYQYPTAIGLFKKLIEFVDGGQEVDERAKAIRSEAVDYLALSLADDDWDGDGLTDPDANVARALSYLNAGSDYEREILEKYADALYNEFEVRKYPMAIEAYRAVIARDQMRPENAAIKEKIIAVYDTMRDDEASIAERQDMVRNFGPGSAWYESNKNHPEVLARVDRRLELALNQAAQFHHKRAQDLKEEAANTGDEKFLVASLQEYKAAAEAYAEYLRRFPESKYAYENAYYYADCLFYSFDFIGAATMYRKVRDWPEKKDYLEVATFNVIDTIEKEAAKRVQDGLLDPADMPGEMGAVAEEQMPEAEGKVDVAELPIPELTQQWMKDVSEYINRGLTRANDPELPARLQYRMAFELYKYRHLEEARKAFEEVITKYPTSVVASYAAANIINSYRLENDWDSIKAWAKKLEELALGSPEERQALATEIKIFQLGAEFKEAERLFENEDWVPAAESFVKVVDADPKSVLADKALQNAAIAYQKANYFESAAKMYQRIVTDYPQSEFVEGALLQLAENARKFFDFDKAVSTYNALRTRFPRSQSVAYSLFTSAELLEAEGRLEDSAKMFEEFVNRYPTDQNAGRTLFRAGRIFEKIGRTSESVRVYKRFLGLFGKQAELSALAIESISRLGDIARADGNKKEWRKRAEETIAEFASRGLAPETPVAAYPARARFQLIEDTFKEYSAIAFIGPLSAQGKLIQRKIELLTKLQAEYSEVLPYKSWDWTFAAFFRLAQTHELFARALFSAEIPEMSEDEMDIYQTDIEDKAAVFQQTAQERFATLLEEGKKKKIANEWTRKALEALNKYRPQEYPLQKEERRAMDYLRLKAPTFEDSI